MKPRKVKIPPRLWTAIGELEIAGTRLSNIAYNLGQCPGTVLTREYCESLRRTQREWDLAQRKVSDLIS